MQDALTAAYLDVAQQVGGAVVPVGEVWRQVIDAGGPSLFDADGSHPSLAGSWVAALTFYAALYKELPKTAKPPAGVSITDVPKITAAVKSVVLENAGKWGL